MPDLAGDLPRRRLAVAGEQHRGQAELLQPPDRVGARRLDRVADRERGARLAVPRDRDRAVAAPDLHAVALDDAADADAREVAEALDRGQRSGLRRGRAGDRDPDRMLGRGLDGAGEPQDLAAGGSVQRREPGKLQPALGHGARLVEHDRADPARLLEDLRAADEDAELRAAARADHQRGRRREPERAGAGDDQHGDGRGERGAGPCPEGEPRGQRRQRDADHDRHEDRGDAVGEPLHGSLARLRRLDEARDLRERRVGADPRRPHDEAAVRVDGRAGELGAGGDLERHRLAREQRPVDRRLALDDDAVGGDLLAGTHEEHVAHPELGDGDELLGAVAAKDAAPPSRRARAAAGSPPTSCASRGPRGSGRAGSAS